MKSLTIRVSDEEHALMQAAAAKRFMTITGMVRAHFHSIFEADGTLPDQQPPAADAANAVTSTAPQRYGPLLADILLPDGTINPLRLVARMRSKANAGFTRKQFSDEYGISFADMELACNEVAKMGEHAAIESWHNGARVNELSAIRGANIRYDKPAQRPAHAATSQVIHSHPTVHLDDVFAAEPATPEE